MNKTKFFTKQKIVWTIIIILILGGAGYFFTRPKNINTNIQTIIVKRQNIESTVLSTGQVVSKTNLNLSFQSSGVVKSLMVKVGDKVKSGDILGTLNQNSVRATLISAQGSLAQAQANYNKIADGATVEQINVSKQAVNTAQVAYDNSLSQLAITKKSTATAIKQAEHTLNDLQSPSPQANNKRTAIIITIAQQLTTVKTDLDQETRILADNNLKDTFGVSNISSLNEFKITKPKIKGLLDQADTSLALAQNYEDDTNLNQAITNAITVLKQNVITLNYAYTALQGSIVSTKLTQAQLDTYKVAISKGISLENAGILLIHSARQALTDSLTNAKNTLTNTQLAANQQINLAQDRIRSAKASLQQAQAGLARLTAKAQTSDLAMAQAQILSAQGNLDSAQIRFNNTILKAPVDGTITAVDTKIGQQINALQEVIVLQNMKSLHTEAYISEANIADLKVGQIVDYTFDALGPNRHFKGKIFDINPASTLISGVVDYLVKATIPNIPEIKPGMTANMTILVNSKSQVLAIPESAIIYQENKPYVRLINNLQDKIYHQVPIQTGLQADGGLVQITSGLKMGQEIVTYIKS